MPLPQAAAAPAREAELNAETAEIVAIKVLSFIADDPARLERFFAATGLTPQEVKIRAGDADFLGGVLDFLLADEPLVLQFADHAGLDPGIVLTARAALPGA